MAATTSATGRLRFVHSPVALDRPSAGRHHLGELVAAHTRHGAPDVLQRVANLYIKESAALLERLSQAVARGDAEEVRLAAHSLKSSSANLGALRLSAMCRDLEQKGRAAELDEAGMLLEEMQMERERYLPLLIAELEADPAAAATEA